MGKNQYLKINDEDNVVVALEDFVAGQTLTEPGLKLKDDIPMGHKIALRNFTEGEDIIKYGYPIGHATGNIKKGEWVHTHNLKTNLEGKLEYKYEKMIEEPVLGSAENVPEFPGYRRPGGRVGVRNEIWVINTVGCINNTVEKLVDTAEKEYESELVAGGIDGIYTFPHPFGCSRLGENLKYTQKILSGLVKHPNAAGVLVIGLGCENNYIDSFKDILGEYDPERVKFLSFQDVEDEFTSSLEIIEELIDYGSRFERELFPASELTLGLKCGGSDAFSGITANPLVGRVSDKLVAAGGGSLLGEVPEMFGAETILMNRARDRETYEKVVQLINDFKDYYISYDQEIYENPSPGNKEGGISTLEEKSLGNIKKGGSTAIMDVLDYGDQSKTRGLQLVNTPGNDAISTTALVAAGAQIVLFTTGRGTPFGTPVPTVKISTNNRLSDFKKHWIDFNAGRLLQGADMEELAEELFDYILEIAGGRSKTRNEVNNYRDIGIFKSGVIL